MFKNFEVECYILSVLILKNGFYPFLPFTFKPFSHLPNYPKIIPAIVADNNEAKDPPKTAFIPKEESTFR
jgi:hypothetical protein